MTIKSAQTWNGLIVTKDSTGALATPTVGPAGVLYVDGVADAASVTITGSNPYKWTVTLPTLTAGQCVSMYITATIATIATASVVAEDVADTVILSDVPAVNVTLWKSVTAPDMTGDAFARLGAPAGASVSADVAAVKAQTAAIEADTQDMQAQVGVDGAGLTAIGDARLANLDAAVSSRLAAASYTAPLDGTATQAAATAALNTYDPPTKAEMDAAFAGISLTVDPQDVADAMARATEETPEDGSVLAQLAAVRLVTDDIDVSAVTLNPENNAGHLTITAALTFETQITSLVVPSDWETALWTLKRSLRDADTAAIAQVAVSNPGALTDGLTVLNGAAATDETMGSLSINAGAGTASLTLSDDLTAQLAVRSGLVWSVKFLTAAGKSKEYPGTADVELSVTHEI